MQNKILRPGEIQKKCIKIGYKMYILISDEFCVNFTHVWGREGGE